MFALIKQAGWNKREVRIFLEINVKKVHKGTVSKWVIGYTGTEMSTQDFSSNQDLKCRKKFKILNIHSFLHRLDKNIIFYLK